MEPLYPAPKGMNFMAVYTDQFGKTGRAYGRTEASARKKAEKLHDSRGSIKMFKMLWSMGWVSSNRTVTC